MRTKSSDEPEAPHSSPNVVAGDAVQHAGAVDAARQRSAAVALTGVLDASLVSGAENPVGQPVVMHQQGAAATVEQRHGHRLQEGVGRVTIVWEQ